MALGAATCLIGFAGQFVSPFHPTMLDAGFEKMPEISEIERMNKLLRMEKLLEDRTEMEINLRKLKAHIIPEAFNLTSGLLIIALTSSEIHGFSKQRPCLNGWHVPPGLLRGWHHLRQKPFQRLLQNSAL